MNTLTSWIFGVARAEQAPEHSSECSRSFPQVWASFYRRAYAATSEQAEKEQVAQLPTVLPAAKRLVAIGDLHGDWGKTLRALQLAGLIDEQHKWSGGDTVVVQVGDQLDRGDSELRILLLLERLQKEAAASGGALHVMNGNHETMNVMGDHRYATSGGNREFAAWQAWRDFNALMHRHSGCGHTQPCPLEARRAAAAGASTSSSTGGHRPHAWMRARTLAPGSHISKRFFAAHPTVLQVGSTVFAHGGILPSHVKYGLEQMNKDTQQWLLHGTPRGAPSFLRGANAVVWARDYSHTVHERCDCDTLQSVLKSLPGAERMVVGHTIQGGGINGACGERVLRVDVGMSKGCGDGPVEVLEVLHDTQIRRLREGLPPLDISSTKENNVSETIPSHGHAAPVGHQQQQQQQLGKLPGSRAAGQNMPPRGSWDVPDQAAINAGLQGVQGPARRSVPVMS